MFPIEAFRDTVNKFVAILRRHDIRYHLTGGVTSIAYADPRMTQDVDLVVENEAVSGKLADFLRSLADSDFLHSPDEVRRAIADRGMFQLLDEHEMLKLDVYAREMVPGELDRSQQGELFDGEFYPLASRADTAVAKLIWISKGSHKSRHDLRHLHRAANAEEQRFIAQMAERFGLTELLAEVLAEPEEFGP